MYECPVMNLTETGLKKERLENNALVKNVVSFMPDKLDELNSIFKWGDTTEFEKSISDIWTAEELEGNETEIFVPDISHM